jgi:lysozyme
MSEATARALLKQRLNRDFFPAVKAFNPPTQNAADALTSFVYNLGTGVLASNTGIGQALRHKDWHKAADELLRWNRAGGKVLPGLVRRRNEERTIMLRGLK